MVGEITYSVSSSGRDETDLILPELPVDVLIIAPGRNDPTGSFTVIDGRLVTTDTFAVAAEV
jgi:hypothetical protein